MKHLPLYFLQKNNRMATKTKTPTAKAVVGEVIKATGDNKGKGFDSKSLEKFKKSKNLGSTAAFKKQTWIPLSDAFNESISLPGIPEGQITVLLGLSDTGKTTALSEAATSSQRMGKLPVFIINEMKFSFDHLKNFGFETTEEVDEETGEIIHTGNFIFADRTMLPSIESTGAFIKDLIDEQAKGKLPYDLVFLIDSMGSLPGEMSLANGKNDGRWNAAAMSLTYSSFINHLFPVSRKITSPYTNTLIVVNKQGIVLPQTIMEKPKRTTKGGTSLYFDAGLVVAFGNITNAGTSKITASKNGKEVVFAKRVNIAVEKNHVTNSTTTSKIIMTDYGFIPDTKQAIEKYKEQHKHEWLSILGTTDVDIIQEADVPEDRVTAANASQYSDLLED